MGIGGHIMGDRKLRRLQRQTGLSFDRAFSRNGYTEARVIGDGACRHFAVIDGVASELPAGSFQHWYTCPRTSGPPSGLPIANLASPVPSDGTAPPGTPAGIPAAVVRADERYRLPRTLDDCGACGHEHVGVCPWCRCAAWTPWDLTNYRRTDPGSFATSKQVDADEVA